MIKETEEEKKKKELKRAYVEDDVKVDSHLRMFSSNFSFRPWRRRLSLRPRRIGNKKV